MRLNVGAALGGLLMIAALAGCTAGVTMGSGTIEVRTWPVAEPLAGELPVGRWLCLPDANMTEMRDSNRARFPAPCNVLRYSRSHAAEFYPDGTGWTLRIYERTNR